MRRILFNRSVAGARVMVFRRAAGAGVTEFRWAAIAVLMFVCGGAVYAQSVDSLVNEAMRNNRQLKGLEQRIRSASYKSESVSYLPAPTLGIEFQQIPFSAPNPFNQPLSENLC